MTPVAAQPVRSDRDHHGGDFWIFGYGSLIWKPPPHFDKRIPGWITGYVRRFWQASQDHRGTPSAPGRVVTLIERGFWEKLPDPHRHAPDRVWGVAYRILPDRVAEVKEYLDIREINGYTIHYEPFHVARGIDTAPLVPERHTGGGHAVKPIAESPAPVIRALVYIGTPDNDQFVGPQDPQQLAEHIYRSQGPSGLNRDYLWGLERALEDLSHESGDEHVSDLSQRVRAVAQREERSGTHQALQGTEALHVTGQAALEPHHGPSPAKGYVLSSVDEQEEIEKVA